jgi:hypothetical protein
MKKFFLVAVIAALATFALSVPTNIFSSHAYANKMNGKAGGGCSDRLCAGINSAKHKPPQPKGKPL